MWRVWVQTPDTEISLLFMYRTYDRQTKNSDYLTPHEIYKHTRSNLSTKNVIFFSVVREKNWINFIIEEASTHTGQMYKLYREIVQTGVCRCANLRLRHQSNKMASVDIICGRNLTPMVSQSPYGQYTCMYVHAYVWRMFSMYG